MKLGVRSILSGVVAAALAVAMVIPTYAAELTIKEQIEQLKSGETIPSITQTTEQTINQMNNFQKVNAFNGFTDVAASDWFYNSVKSCYEFDLMKGSSVAAFNPSGNVTLAEAITMASRVYKIYHEGNGDFQTSGSDAAWYQVYVDYALEKGIIAAGDFLNYNIDAARLDVAYIFANALPSSTYKKIGSVCSYAGGTTPSIYIPDVGYGTPHYLDIIKLYEAGIITGSGTDRGFQPSKSIQRSEVAAIVSRLADPEQRVSITLTAIENRRGDINIVGSGIVYQSDMNRRTALAGDTFVKLDGTKIVLVLDEASGVLGYGQGVATDLGRLVPDQKEKNPTVQHGFQIVTVVCDTPYYRDSHWLNGGASYRGQKYLVNPYNGSGFWSGEWTHVAIAYQPSSSNPGAFDGQLSKDKNFFWSEIGESWNLVVNAVEYVQSVNPTGKQ